MSDFKGIQNTVTILAKDYVDGLKMSNFKELGNVFLQAQYAFEAGFNAAIKPSDITGEPNYDQILKENVDYYGETRAAYHYAANKYARELTAILENKLRLTKNDLYTVQQAKESLYHQVVDKDKQINELQNYIKSLNKV